MLFYILTILDLGTRMSGIIVLYSKPFFATDSLALSVISLMLSLFVGTMHTHILMRLIVDLKTMNCSNEANYSKVTRLQTIFRLSIIAWTTVLVSCSVVFLLVKKYDGTILILAILFCFQTSGIIYVNYILHSTLTGIFKQD